MHSTDRKRTEPAMRLPTPYRDECEVVAQRLAFLTDALDWRAAAIVATPWVENVRRHPPPSGPWKACCANIPSAAPKAWP